MAETAPIDLFALAAANRAALDERFEALCARLTEEDEGTARGFVRRLESDLRISINMKQRTLEDFLAIGRHLNIYEWAARQARWSSHSAEEWVRAKLKTRYERRVAFDRSFRDGERFHYGALNLGNIGLLHYGLFCLVLAASFPPERDPIAYVWADSLLTYLLRDDGGFTIDRASLARDVAPHSHRHILAALKHAEESLRSPPAEWPDLVCSSAASMDVIFLSAVTPSEVIEVRARSSDTDRVRTAAFEHIAGIKELDEADQLLAAGFVTLRELLEKLSIPFILVEEDEHA